MIDEELVSELAATMAPYKIFKVGKKYVVKNNAGETKASFEDRNKAVAHLRALYVNVQGAPKAAARKKWSGEQKRATHEKAHGSFVDAEDAVKKKHQHRPMSHGAHSHFVYGGSGSWGKGALDSPCKDCGQGGDHPVHSDPAPASSGGSSGGQSTGGSAGGTATAALLEGAGGYPCPCGRDFASAQGLARHIVAFAEAEDSS